MPLPDSYIDMLKGEIARLRERLEPLEAGKLRLGERRSGGAWQDVTQPQIDHLRRTIKVYEEIVGNRAL